MCALVKKERKQFSSDFSLLPLRASVGQVYIVGGNLRYKEIWKKLFCVLRNNWLIFHPTQYRHRRRIFGVKGKSEISGLYSHLSAERPAERVRASGRRKSWDALRVRVAVWADGSEEVGGDVQLLGALLRLGTHRAAGACTHTPAEHGTWSDRTAPASQRKSPSLVGVQLNVLSQVLV